MEFKTNVELNIERPGLGLVNSQGQLIAFIAEDGEIIAATVTCGADAVEALRAPVTSEG